MPPPAVHLDSASAEPMHPAARDALLAAAEHAYADPRRLHHAGRRARQVWDNARAVVAECLGCRPEEATFTSSGTAAVHAGVLGLLAGLSNPTATASAVEHSAVRNALRFAQVPVSELGVDEYGRVDDAALSGDSLLAVQAANHEVGTLQPVDRVAATWSGPVFVDACAAAGRVELPQTWSALAASAHKWGGPAGVGILLIRRGTRWRHPGPGDERVDDRSVGFENVPAAFAAAASLQAVLAERDQVAARQRALIDRLRQQVAALPDIEVVGHPTERLPHLLTFSCLYVDGEALVTELDRRGYAVASGSACAAADDRPSHVLAAMGALTHGNVRVSLTRETTAADLDGFVAALTGAVAELRGRVGL